MPKFIYRAVKSDQTATLEVPQGFEPPRRVFIPDPTHEADDLMFELVVLDPLTEAVGELLTMDSHDYEAAHSRADELLLMFVPERLASAYRDLKGRAKNWPMA